MQHKLHKLTPEGKTMLELELDHIRDIERPRVVKGLKAWREGGDATDNAAFEQMKERLAALSDRIVEIEALLRESQIIDNNGHRKNGAVEVGSVVTVTRDDGRASAYVIVDVLEAAPQQGRISDISPIGSALLGRRTGDTVQVRVPSGTLTLTITGVQ